MGYSASGVSEVGAPATVFNMPPPTDGTTWVTDNTFGLTSSTQVLGPVNPALQNFILQQTTGAEVPLAQQYTASPGVVTGTPGSTFNFTLPTQQQVADGAGFLSNQLAVASTSYAGLAARTAPALDISVPAAAAALWTGVGSFALAGVQQAAQPNFGQTVYENGLIGLMTYVGGNIVPEAGPLYTILGNAIPSIPNVSPTEKNINNFFNLPSKGP